MSAHDRQLEAYEPMYALAELMLGILHTAERVERLLQHPRSADQPSADSPVADALLGLIALQRTLRMCVASQLAATSGEASPEPIAHQSLLR